MLRDVYPTWQAATVSEFRLEPSPAKLTKKSQPPSVYMDWVES